MYRWFVYNLMEPKIILLYATKIYVMPESSFSTNNELI